MGNHYHSIRRVIETVSLSLDEKQELELVLSVMEKEEMRKDFMLQKMAESKKTTEAFLNKTVEDLEVKNRELSTIVLERELVNDQLVSINEELEQFAFIISHDLQEPLRTIMNFTNLLFVRKQNQLDEQTKTYLDFISQSSLRLSNLIMAMLDYSRIGKTGKMSSVDCNTLIKEVLRDLNLTIKEKKAIIQIGDLPVVNGFQMELHSLFQNLLSNAIKYSREGIAPEICIECMSENDVWHFSVRDNGIGIREDHLERIFVIFKRLNSFPDQEGSGIGLSRCKKIVELHSGKIWVESVPDKGSIFHFYIPK